MFFVLSRTAGRAFSGRLLPAVLAVPLGLAIGACDVREPDHTLLVTVTAYNSLPAQTDSRPFLAAWGDRLEPGMKAVAVSPDLLELGLTRGTKIRIEGLEGDYVVLDRTASRFEKRVDVYMGLDLDKAREFGVRQLFIAWND